MGNVRKKKWLFYLLPLLVIAGLCVYRFYPFENQKTTDAGPQNGGKPKAGAIPVQAVIAGASDISSSIQAVGTLMPNEEVDLIAEGSGKVVAIYFNEGERVKKGQLLLKVDDADLQAQHQRATFQLDLLSEKLRRQRILFEKDAVSREEFDQVQTDYNVIKSDIELLNVKISKTELRAPFDGIVGFRNVSLGAYLQPNTVVTHLVDDNRLKIEFSIPEKYASLPLIGATIKFTIEASDKTFLATVYAVDPRVDPDTRTIMLRARCDQTDRSLSSGMFARINLITSQSSNSILVPTESVVPEMDGKSLWIVKNGKAASVSVGIGQRTASQIEIVSGVAMGDTVLVSGLMQIREGSDVKPEIIK